MFGHTNHKTTELNHLINKQHPPVTLLFVLICACNTLYPLFLHPKCLDYKVCDLYIDPKWIWHEIRSTLSLCLIQLGVVWRKTHTSYSAGSAAVQTSKKGGKTSVIIFLFLILEHFPFFRIKAFYHPGHTCRSRPPPTSTHTHSKNQQIHLSLSMDSISMLLLPVNCVEVVREKPVLYTE